MIGWISAITGSAEAQPGQLAQTITRRLYMARLFSSEAQELAVVDPAATSGWTGRSTQGVDFRLPAGWQEVPWEQGRLGGVSIVRYSGPACISSGPCERTAEVLVMVERTDNQASASNHTLAATLQDQGYYRLAATIGGQPAMILLPPDGASSGMVIAERAGVRYTIAFAPELWEDQSRFLKLIVGTMDLQPDQAPAPFIAPAKRAAPAPAAPDASAPQAAVPLNLADMVEYARVWGTRRNNSNGCYVHTYTVDIGGGATSTTIQCQFTPGFTNVLADGAHFIDCALKAGGLPKARCNVRSSLADYEWGYYQIKPLYEMLLSYQYTIITDVALIRPGDIAIVGDGQINPTLPNFNSNRACWMGIVLPSQSNPAVMHIAAHSVNQTRDQIDITPTSMFCGTSPNPQSATRIYMRLRTDETRPTVAFSEPAPGRFAYGATPTLRWLGIDEVDGSGIQGYSLRRKVNAGAWQDLLTLQPVTERIESLNQPCNTVLYEITAIDNAGNPSLPATLTMTVGLQGDFDLNGMVDTGDTQLVDAAWGMGSRSENFDSRLDITGDGNINVADLTWMHLHQGDRCAN